MSDKAWKQFERHAASLFDGKRHWANSGERVDFESEYAIGQCKLVKSLSLEALTKLAEEMERDGEAKKKIGVVVTKVRRGSGKSSPTLITMTEMCLARLVCYHIQQMFDEEKQNVKKSASNGPSDQSGSDSCSAGV